MPSACLDARIIGGSQGGWSIIRRERGQLGHASRHDGTPTGEPPESQEFVEKVRAVAEDMGVPENEVLPRLLDECVAKIGKALDVAATTSERVREPEKEKRG